MAEPTQNLDHRPGFAGVPADRYRCPDCSGRALQFGTAEAACPHCDARFPIVDGKPVLVPHGSAFFDVLSQRGPTRVGRRPGLAGALRALVPSPGVNLARAQHVDALFRSVEQRDDPAVLVLGAANQRDELRDVLNGREHVRVVYTDVDPGALIDVYADAQCIPFDDATFDAVLATGILNSTLYPQRAVAEMHRVLVDGGALYSEVPFVQQVVFGPYDFQRFTLSGHRHLFRAFAIVASGMVAGPATVLYWTIESLALCLATGSRSRNALKAVLRLTLSWIKYLDHLLQSRPAAVDGASNTYVLARKRDGFEVSDGQIISGYTGAQ